MSLLTLLTVSTETNSLDPDQTAPVGSGSTLFVEEASKISRQHIQMTFVVIGALRVNRIMKMLILTA